MIEKIYSYEYLLKVREAYKNTFGEYPDIRIYPIYFSTTPIIIHEGLIQEYGDYVIIINGKQVNINKEIINHNVFYFIAIVQKNIV